VLTQDTRLSGCIFTHYSSLSKDLRLETEKAFSEAGTAICVATSTLELGIDIGDVDAVVLWGVPSGTESFMQRIGRGSRRLNKTNVVCYVPDCSSCRVADLLRFLALIHAGREGLLPVREPYRLYGAAGQQCLSAIASNNGRFTRVADLAGLMGHLPHLDRSRLELILAELAAQGYVQHHGFKNRYGGAEGLYRLVDHRMIYGNFGLGSQDVEIRHGSKALGSVPSINLLRVAPGDVVRFAGRRWIVRRSDLEGITVEPSKKAGTAVDFIYPGKGLGFDSSLTELMWKIIHEPDLPKGVLPASVREMLSLPVSEIRSLGKRAIPFAPCPLGVCYLTFAGYLVNKALALITSQSEYEATDLSLIVPVSIEWGSIPTGPPEYQPVFPQLFEASSEQSIYQTFLPVDLQREEFLQEWLKDETIPRVLTRLSNGTPREIPAEVMAVFTEQ